MGAREFWNRQIRWCLWLKNAEPAELKKMPLVVERIKAVKEFRLNSTKAATRKFADMPTLFQEDRQPDDGVHFIAAPEVSSGARRYVPMDFMDSSVVVSNKIQMIAGAELYHFGILSSNVHNAWVRTVCGRLKSDYDYSNKIVYNNFPWPTPTPEQRAEIERTAQGILDARANHPGSSLADLYDDVFMPKDLREAHRANDRATLRAYGFPLKITEPDCVAELMKRYEALASN